MKKTLIYQSIALATLSSLQPAFASDNYEEVIVSATRVEGPAIPVATNISVISQDDIKLSGATRLAEVLRSQAGIQVQDLDGSGGRNVTISTRGFSSNAANNTLVLVDGRKLNNPTLAGPNLSSIDLANIERIEIVHGSAGVLYGEQAVGGVINIVTRRPQAGETRGSAGLTVGSDDLQEYRASFSQGLDNGFSYRLSGIKKGADNYRDNNENDYDSALINLRYEQDAGYVFAEAQNIDDDLNLPGSLSLAQVKEDPRQSSTPGNFSDRQTNLLRIGGGYSLTANWTLLGEYSWRDEDTLYSFGTPTDQNTKQKSFTPRVQGKFSAPGGTALLTLGYDKTRSSYEVPAWFTDVQQDIDAWYGYLVYPLTEALTLTGGVRRSEVDDDNKGLSTSHEDELEAYELGASYQLSQQLRLFTRYADGFRFANADENGFVLPGVDFLNPQTSESLEAGVEWDDDALGFKVTLYDLDIDDELFYDSEVPNAFSWSGLGANVNLPDAKRQGVTVEARYQLSPAIEIKGNYSYTDAEMKSGSFAGNEVPFVAAHTGTLATIFHMTEALSFYVDANYTGSRYRIGDDANTAGRIDDYILVNANLLWQSRQWQANLRVANLTNEEYADYEGVSPWSGLYFYPQPGTRVEASVSYHF